MGRVARVDKRRRLSRTVTMLKRPSVKFSTENKYSKTPKRSGNSSSFKLLSPDENNDIINITRAGHTPHSKTSDAEENIAFLKENLKLGADFFAGPTLSFGADPIPLSDVSNIAYSPQPSRVSSAKLTKRVTTPIGSAALLKSSLKKSSAHRASSPKASRIPSAIASSTAAPAAATFITAAITNASFDDDLIFTSIVPLVIDKSVSKKSSAKSASASTRPPLTPGGPNQLSRSRGSTATSSSSAASTSVPISSDISPMTRLDTTSDSRNAGIATTEAEEEGEETTASRSRTHQMNKERDNNNLFLDSQFDVSMGVSIGASLHSSSILGASLVHDQSVASSSNKPALASQYMLPPQTPTAALLGISMDDSDTVTSGADSENAQSSQDGNNNNNNNSNNNNNNSSSNNNSNNNIINKSNNNNNFDDSVDDEDEDEDEDEVRSNAESFQSPYLPSDSIRKVATTNQSLMTSRISSAEVPQPQFSRPKSLERASAQEAAPEPARPPLPPTFAPAALQQQQQKQQVRPAQYIYAHTLVERPVIPSMRSPPPVNSLAHSPVRVKKYLISSDASHSDDSVSAAPLHGGETVGFPSTDVGVSLGKGPGTRSGPGGRSRPKPEVEQVLLPLPPPAVLSGVPKISAPICDRKAPHGGHWHMEAGASRVVRSSVKESENKSAESNASVLAGHTVTAYKSQNSPPSAPKQRERSYKEGRSGANLSAKSKSLKKTPLPKMTASVVVKVLPKSSASKAVTSRTPGARSQPTDESVMSLLTDNNNSMISNAPFPNQSCYFADVNDSASLAESIQDRVLKVQKSISVSEGVRRSASAQLARKKSSSSGSRKRSSSAAPKGQSNSHSHSHSNIRGGELEDLSSADEAPTVRTPERSAFDADKSSPMFMSYRKAAHESDSEDEIAEFGLAELLTNDQSAVGRAYRTTAGLFQHTEQRATFSAVKKAGFNNAAAVAMDIAGLHGSPGRLLSRLKASGSRENSAPNSRSNSAMRGGASRVSILEQQQQQCDGSDLDRSRVMQSARSPVTDCTTMAVKLATSDVVDDMTSVEAEAEAEAQIEPGNESFVSLALSAESCGANTTMTLDHTYLLNNTGLYSFDPETSMYQKHCKPSTVVAKDSVPRMAIRSIKREKHSLPDVKEILFQTVPGKHTTINLRFSNQYDKTLSMKAQCIQIRFETVNQFLLVENQLDIGNYNAFEVAKGGSQAVPQGGEGTVQVVFAPMMSVEGNYSGALKVKYGKKSFMLLLRGEARFKALDGPSPASAVKTRHEANPRDATLIDILEKEAVLEARQARRAAGVATDVLSPMVGPQPEESLLIFQQSVRSRISHMMASASARDRDRDRDRDGDGDEGDANAMASPLPAQPVFASPIANAVEKRSVVVIPSPSPSPNPAAAKQQQEEEEERQYGRGYEETKESPEPAEHMHIRSPQPADAKNVTCPSTENLLRRIRKALEGGAHAGFLDVPAVPSPLVGIAVARSPSHSHSHSPSPAVAGLPPRQQAPAFDETDVSASPFKSDQTFVSEMGQSARTFAQLHQGCDIAARSPLTQAQSQMAVSTAPSTAASRLHYDTAHLVHCSQSERSHDVASPAQSHAQSAVTTTNYKVLDAKKGVFFRRGTVDFGLVAVGMLARAKVELCNATDKEVVAFLGDPAMPFVVMHNEVRLRARSYVRVPVRFVSVEPSSFEAELLVQTEDGAHHSSIKLLGRAY